MGRDEGACLPPGQFIPESAGEPLGSGLAVPRGGRGCERGKRYGDRYSKYSEARRPLDSEIMYSEAPEIIYSKHS